MKLIYNSNSLEHHGVKGQKWGRRRFQNADGSLTPMGRQRYGYSPHSVKKLEKQYTKTVKAQGKMSKAMSKVYEKNKALVSVDESTGKRSVVTRSKEYGEAAQKYNKQVKKLNKQVSKFNKKYGDKAFSSIEKEINRSPKVKKAREFANLYLSKQTLYQQLVMKADIPKQ